MEGRFTSIKTPAEQKKNIYINLQYTYKFGLFPEWIFLRQLHFLSECLHLLGKMDDFESSKIRVPKSVNLENINIPDGQRKQNKLLPI